MKNILCKNHNFKILTNFGKLLKTSENAFCVRGRMNPV